VACCRVPIETVLRVAGVLDGVRQAMEQGGLAQQV
jgi:hypothetical protein